MEMPEVVEIAQAHGVHPSAVCLKWGVQRGQIVIPFSVKEKNYVGNLACVTSDPLTDDEMNMLHRVGDLVRQNIAVPCTSCRYCVQHCPKNIAIPEYFSLYNAEKRTRSRDFSTQGMIYRGWNNDHGKASDCIECHACERACPQHLPIVDYLKLVAETFEG